MSEQTNSGDFSIDVGEQDGRSALSVSGGAGKHTPGPWEWDGESRIDAVALRKPSGHIVKKDDGTEFVFMDGLVALPYSCGSGTHEANARLIAAAPELLDALCGLLDDTQHKHHDCGDEKYCPVLHARAAIAKATGGAA